MSIEPTANLECANCGAEPPFGSFSGGKCVIEKCVECGAPCEWVEWVEKPERKHQYNRKEHRMLSPAIMVVAVEGSVNDWAAYIAVTSYGEDDGAIEYVAAHGHKIRRVLAEFLFPEWKQLDWRD